MAAAHKIQPGESVEAWIARQPHPDRLHALRRLLLDRGLEERVKWSQPWYEGRGNVAYLSDRADYTTLGFCEGASLADPSGLLEGTGKAMRHVKVWNDATVRSADLQQLVDAALAFDAA